MSKVVIKPFGNNILVDVEPPRFIVGEVSKNWPSETPWNTISLLLELMINANAQRGYVLHSFQLHRYTPAPGEMNETVIAVFERPRPLEFPELPAREEKP